MSFNFFAGYDGGTIASHTIEDWADGSGTGRDAIGARTTTVDGIVTTRSDFADWWFLPDGNFGIPYEAWLSGDDGSGGGPYPPWASPTILGHEVAGTGQVAAFGVTIYPSNYYVSPSLPTQIDVEIATAESGFDGPHVARFRAERHQSTMGGIDEIHWGILQADSSYVDGGIANDIYYTLGVDIFGNWEVRQFDPGGGFYQAGGSGTALTKSPSNTYLVRTVAQHSGWVFNVNVNQIRAWTWVRDDVTPVRLYPRDDGRGMSSAPRLWPPAKGRSRVIGGYP